MPCASHFLEADSATVHPRYHTTHTALPLNAPINYNHQLCDTVGAAF